MHTYTDLPNRYEKMNNADAEKGELNYHFSPWDYGITRVYLL